MARGSKTKKVADPTAFPYKQITVLAICRFAEPIAFNSIMAYSFAMTKELKGDDGDASFYSGLLVSAYAVAETLTAMWWGVLSDRFGRKPIVLTGLAGVAISCLILGFAKNYWVAFAARLIGGALNGNVSVMQTMVAEIVKIPEHEPAAYATQPFVWTLGGLVGSAMGGYLAQPALYYPNLFPQDGIFGRFPYLLPNIASCAIVLISIVQGIFLLEETNPKVLNKGGKYAELETEEDEEDEEDETSPLNPGKANALEQTPSNESTPLISQDSFGTMSGSHETVASSASSQTIAEPVGEYDGPIWNFPIFMLVLQLFIYSYHQMSFITLVPIHVIDTPAAPKGHLDFKGGFGLSLHDVSTFLLAEGVSSLVIQAFIFPPMLKKLGVWWAFVMMATLYPICYLIMPFLWAAPGFLRPGVYIALILQAFFGISLNPSILIMLKHSCPDSRALGRVMGLGMAACCLARTVAPPLVGIVYDEGGSGAAWFSSGAIAVIGAIEMLFVPRVHIKKSALTDIPVGGH